MLVNAALAGIDFRELLTTRDTTRVLVEATVVAAVLEQRQQIMENLAIMIGNAVAKSLGG